MDNILQTALDALIAEREKLGDLNALILTRDRLDAQIAQLKGILDPAPIKAAGKRNLSPEARQRIADGQKKRWQAKHASQTETAPVPVE